MTRNILLIAGLLAAYSPLVPADILRGEVQVDVEPVYALSRGVPSPLDDDALLAWALEESARSYAGMIYGWSFEYEPGEKARDLAEHITLAALGTVGAHEPALKTDRVDKNAVRVSVWTDYHLSETQSRRRQSWSATGSIEAQAHGTGALDLSPVAAKDIMAHDGALEDAARSAIRARLRATERNRPRRVKGRIALAAFPHYGIQNGALTVQARFRLKIGEVEPYAVY